MMLISKLKKQIIMSEPRTLAGIGLISLSYISCWPVISVLGILSAWIDKPALVMVGGPAVYLLSCLFLVAGLVLAGKECATMVKTRAIIYAKKLLPIG